MYVSVEHIELRRIIALETWQRIMVHDNMTAVICNFHAVSNLYEEATGSARKFFGVMVTANQYLTSIELFQIVCPIGLFIPNEVAQDIYGIRGFDACIPIGLDGHPHLTESFEGTIIKTNCVFVSDMTIGNKKIHCLVLSVLKSGALFTSAQTFYS
jgi:hypothetical protein